MALSALTWIDWAVEGGSPFGIPYPVLVTVVLVLNIAATVRFPRGKRRVVAAAQRYLVNPIVAAVVRLGVPLGWSLLETTGRTTGRRRVVPVGNGHEGDRFWVVAEHGLSAGYIRNLRADPRVRVQVRSGWRLAWRTGVAHVLLDDDPARRQRLLVGRRHPVRALNAVLVNVLAVDPVTVRIDLDPTAEDT
ncbi:MAG TPA: nitroreductase/quinone reductase family protein [Aldersonia sp.]